MYEYLEGRLVSRRPARVVLDVNGVGYDLAVPLGAEFQSSGDEGRVRVWTHLVVREDAHMLFGFPDPDTRETFRLLLKVRGVGPGLAQAILSSLPGKVLLESIAAGDAAALTRIKGVGKKTAEQILLDLRDKATVKPADAGVLVPVGRAQLVEDAVRALVSIGYSDKQARQSVERAAKRISSDDLEELVRGALQE